MPEIKNVVFDMGGVLVDLRRDRCIEAFRGIGFHEADELLNSYRQKGIFAGLEKGTASPREMFDYVRERSTQKPSDRQIADALILFLDGLPEYRLDMLLGLRERYKVYMLSNTNPVMWEYIAKEYFSAQGLAVGDYFDELFLSWQMKAMKPDREIFELMISQTGLKPEETLFIDDGQANVEAAAALGFQTYLPVSREDIRRPLAGILAEG